MKRLSIIAFAVVALVGCDQHPATPQQYYQGGAQYSAPQAPVQQAPVVVQQDSHMDALAAGAIAGAAGYMIGKNAGKKEEQRYNDRPRYQDQPKYRPQPQYVQPRQNYSSPAPVAKPAPKIQLSKSLPAPTKSVAPKFSGGGSTSSRSGFASTYRR